MAGIGYALGFLAGATPAVESMTKSVRKLAGKKRPQKAKYNPDTFWKKYDQYQAMINKRR